MADKDVIGLLFLPSFSTSEKVTDVSGRGVGLDVVKSKIESLSGEVEVKTKLGRGKYLYYQTSADTGDHTGTDGRSGWRKICDPAWLHQTIEDVEPAEIKYVQAKEVINLRGTVIPLIRLNRSAR